MMIMPASSFNISSVVAILSREVTPNFLPRIIINLVSFKCREAWQIYVHIAIFQVLQCPTKISFPLLKEILEDLCFTM